MFSPVINGPSATATSGKAAASSSNCNSLANCSLITSDKEQDIVF